MSHRRSVALPVGFAVVLLAVVGLFGPNAHGAVTSCPVTASDQVIDDQEQQLATLINQYRATNGLRSLSFQSDVVRSASWFSRDMATKNYFPPNHVDSNGRTVPQRLTWCGAAYTNWAENIFAGRSDAQSTFNAWKNSTGHNANMLRTGVTSAGIARAFDTTSTYKWYWTLDLTNSSPSPSTTVSPTTTRVSSTTTRPPATTTPSSTTTPPPTTTPPTTTPPTTTAPTSTVPRPFCPPALQALCDRAFGR